MKRLVNYIKSHFCKHEWKVLDRYDIYHDTDTLGDNIVPYVIGETWVCECTKCGRIKVHRNRFRGKYIL